MKRWMDRALLPAVLLMALLCGCGLFGDKEPPSLPEESEEEHAPEYPVEAGGIVLSARPGTVVSLAPALTEKLYDLGMQQRLTGVSDYCDFPEEITGLPTCGTAQLPDLEQLEALAPHLVLAEAELPQQVEEALAQLDIPVAVLPHAESVEALMQTYIDLARLLEGDTSGALIAGSLVDDFRGRLDALHAHFSAYTQEAGRKKALYLRLLDFTVATGGTFENELLDTICLDNIAEPYTDWTYPEEQARSAEGLAAFASVDILFMDEAFVTIKDLEGNAFYKGLPATIQDRYLYISSLSMERQSLRSLYMLEDMASAAYPEAGLPAGNLPAGEDAPVAPDMPSAPADSDEAAGDEMLAALDDMPKGQE